MSTSSRFTDADVPDQSGRTFLVTGANTGLGFEATKVLAARGARVLLGCRSRERADAAADHIRAEQPDADLRIIDLDQADLASVRAAAEAVAEEPRLDVLVNNAGIMGVPRGTTADGFESHFGVNHLGTFALTAHLLEKLGESEGSRVVVTSSLGHRAAKLNFDRLGPDGRYNALERYTQSKLANVLHFTELDRRLRAAGANTIAVGCHPGVAETELARHGGLMLKLSAPLFRVVSNTAAQGAWPTLMAATAPGVSGGEYFGPSRLGETSGPARRARISKTGRDQALAARLWDVSVEMTGVDPGI